MAKKKTVTAGEYVSISSRLPKALWQKIKGHCVKADKTVQAFLVEVLEKAVKK